VRTAFPNTSRVLLAILLGLILSMFECATGHWMCYRGQCGVWDYEQGRLFGIMPFCDGYASLTVTIGWMVAAYIVILLFDSTERM
jgi:hypothetical protein